MVKYQRARPLQDRTNVQWTPPVENPQAYPVKPWNPAAVNLQAQVSARLQEPQSQAPPDRGPGAGEKEIRVASNVNVGATSSNYFARRISICM